MKIALFISIFCLMTGCATMNNSVYSDAQVIKSSFDGSYEIHLEPVGAASGFKDNPQSLGAFWTSKSPSSAVLDAQVPGLKGIKSIAFNIDGKIYEITKSTSQLTNTKVENTGAAVGTVFIQSTSTKGFEVPLEVIKQLVDAEEVKIKFSFIDNTYGVSTCGKKHAMCAATPKLADFVRKVETVRAEAKI